MQLDALISRGGELWGSFANVTSENFNKIVEIAKPYLNSSSLQLPDWWFSNGDSLSEKVSSPEAHAVIAGAIGFIALALICLRCFGKSPEKQKSE